MRIGIRLPREARIVTAIRAAALPDDSIELHTEGDVIFVAEPPTRRAHSFVVVVAPADDVAALARASWSTSVDAVAADDASTEIIRELLARARGEAPLQGVLRVQTRIVSDLKEALEREESEPPAVAPRFGPDFLEAPDVASFLAAVRHEERMAEGHGRTFAVIHASRGPARGLELLPFDVVHRGEALLVLLPEATRERLARVVAALESPDAGAALFPRNGASAAEWTQSRLSLPKDP